MEDLNQRFNTMHSDLISASRKNDCSASVFIELYSIPASNAHFYLREGLKNPDLNPDTIRELFNKGNKGLVEIITKVSNLPEDIILSIINNKNNDMIINLSANKNLNKKYINKLLEYAFDNKIPDIIINLLNIKRISLIDCIKNKDKLEPIFNNSKYNLDDIICNYIENASINSLIKIYPECHDDKYLISIIRNKKVSPELLENICFNNGNNLIYYELSKTDRITLKIKKYLLTLNEQYIYVNLCKNGICDIDDIISILRKYYDDKVIFDICLEGINNRLKKHDERIYSRQFEELSKYNNKKIDLVLANNANVIDVDNQIELLKRGDEKIFSAVAKSTRYVYILRLIALSTKDLDTFAECAYNSSNSPEDVTILSWTDMYKHLMLSKHPRFKEINEAFHEWGTATDRLFKNTETNNRMLGNFLVDLGTSRVLGFDKNKPSNTSLIQSSDEIDLNDQNRITIKPENFDVILHNLELNNEEEVTYGKYPSKKEPKVVCGVLDFLYKYRVLQKTGKKYRILGSDNKIYNLQEFSFEDKNFVKYTTKDGNVWVEVKPITWKVNKTSRTLEMTENIPNLDLSTSEKFLTTYFKSDILEPYKISEEELNYKKELEKKREQSASKFKAIESKEKEDELNQEIEDKYKELSTQLTELKKTLEFLEKRKMANSNLVRGLLSSISVPEDELIVEINGHREFNKDYIELLKFIDLSLLDVTNLKLSGLDLRGTNIRINPQIIFNKDLSNSKLSDDNVIWASFKDVDLRGADISEEKESYDIEYAIIDDLSKLPKIITAKKQI